jgi:hypothetical protein
MRRANGRLVLGWHVMLVVGVALVGVFDSPAEARVRAHPLVVRFVGTFQPYAKEEAGALHTLTVSHKDQLWLFKVERVNVISGGQDSGTMLLSRIVPPRLALSGPSAFIESLKKPETLGKRLTLQGWLDLRVRTLRVAEVQEEPAAAPPGRGGQLAPRQEGPGDPTTPHADLSFGQYESHSK